MTGNYNYETGSIKITWHFDSVIGFTQLESVAEILHSLFTYTLVRGVLNDNRCTYNIDNQYCLLLNILGDTSLYTDTILILSFESYPIFEHLTSFRPAFFYQLIYEKILKFCQSKGRNKNKNMEKLWSVK